MISPVLIAASAAVAAVVVTLVARLSRWPAHQSSIAALLSVIAIIAWRLSSNVLHLNADFAPAISPGDLGCLAAGAFGPAIVHVRHRLPRAVLVVASGALGAFVANVVLL